MNNRIYRTSFGVGLDPFLFLYYYFVEYMVEFYFLWYNNNTIKQFDIRGKEEYV